MYRFSSRRTAASANPGTGADSGAQLQAASCQLLVLIRCTLDWSECVVQPRRQSRRAAAEAPLAPLAVTHIQCHPLPPSHTAVAALPLATAFACCLRAAQPQLLLPLPLLNCALLQRLCTLGCSFSCPHCPSPCCQRLRSATYLP